MKRGNASFADVLPNTKPAYLFSNLKSRIAFSSALEAQRNSLDLEESILKNEYPAG
jgi:hypothetical protein